MIVTRPRRCNPVCCLRAELVMHWRILAPLLAVTAGIVLGVYWALGAVEPAPGPPPQVLQLDAEQQSDYILNVADAYAADGNLKLAQDRLARLDDAELAQRIETFAIDYASRRNRSSVNLIRLAIALGSRNRGLIAVIVTLTPPPASPTPKTRLYFSNVRATRAPTATPAPTETLVPTAAATQEPSYVVVPNENPYFILPTNTFTPSPTRRPATRVPTATNTPPPTPVPPPPPVIFEPGFPGGWPPGVYFVPAQVEPGQGYWHLTRAVYCDFVEDNFDCPDRPGNRSGTSIYVMSHGNAIDVIRPDGVNVGGDPTQIGDLKAEDDMCLCTWTFLVSDYKVSVAGAPSDAIGGFALYTVGGNVLAGHAHVRYFLYFDYVTR